MSLQMPCMASGCDQPGRVCLLAPAGMADDHVRIWARVPRLAHERGIELATYCELHQALIREDKLEIVGRDGARLRLYDDP